MPSSQNAGVRSASASAVPASGSSSTSALRPHDVPTLPDPEDGEGEDGDPAPHGEYVQRRAPRRTGRDGGGDEGHQRAPDVRADVGDPQREAALPAEPLRHHGPGRDVAQAGHRDAQEETKEVELPERLYVAQAEKRRRDAGDRAGEHGARPKAFRQAAHQRAGQRHGQQERPAHRCEGAAAPAHLRHHRLQEHGEDVPSEPQSHLADEARDQHQPAAVGRHGPGS